MPGRGVHFAVDRPTLAALLLAEDPARRLALLDRLEAAWDDLWLCETDKAWPAIDRALATDAERFPDSPLGAHELDVGPQVRASLLTASEVKALAAAVAPLGPPEFAALYRRIDPAAHDQPLSGADLEYTWAWFLDLQDLLRRAADADRAVIFTVGE